MGPSLSIKHRPFYINVDGASVSFTSVGATPVVSLGSFPVAKLVHSNKSSTSRTASQFGMSQVSVTTYWYMPTVFEERLHRGCNSPPVEMNQPQNATLAAPSPPTRSLANEREISGLCWFLVGSKMTSFSLPNWPKNNSNIYWGYFLSQTTTARPQTKLSVIGSTADKLYSVSRVLKNHVLTVCICAFEHGCLCVHSSVGVCPPTVCVYVTYTCWKNGKSTFFQPENNWSPEPLWVAHQCEVRVGTDQH